MTQLPFRELHDWTNKAGERWVCAAYDHGPMCRLCKLVDPDDEALIACINNVKLGYFNVATDPDGELRFQLTALGEERVKEMIDGD